MTAKEIRQYIDKNEERLDNLELYALMNCLDEDDLTILYFDYGLEHLVLNYISKYIKNQNRSYHKVIKDVYNSFSLREPYENRKNIRDYILSIFPQIDKELQYQFFYLLIKSDHYIDLRRAAQISSIIWDIKVKEAVIDLFRKNASKFIAEVLINNLSKNEVTKLFNILWSESLSNTTKNSLIEKADFKAINLEKILDKLSLKSFMLLALEKGDYLKVIEEDYENLEYPDRIYVKWCVGKKGYADLLIKLIEIDSKVDKNSYV